MNDIEIETEEQQGDMVDQAVQDQLAELDSLADEFSPQTEPDQQGAESEIDLPEIDLSEVLAGIVNLGCEGLASRRGPHWKKAPDQIELVAKAVVPVVYKYAPSAGDSAEGKLALAVIAVFGPSLIAELKLLADPQIEQESDASKRESKSSE